MSTWKTAVATFVALAAILGILLLTGVVRVGGGASEGNGEDDAAAGEEGSDDDAPKRTGGKAKRGKKKRKGGLAQLESLGYVGAEEIRPEDRGKIGVTKHDKGKAYEGLNLFNPCAWGKKYRKASGGKILRESQIIDMEGNVLHRWETTFGSNTSRGWEISRLSDDGFLYAVNARTGFVKMDWDSNTIWGLEGGYHHDFQFGPDGNLWVLWEKKREVPVGDEKALILDNGFAVITTDGKVERELSFYDQLEDNEHFTKTLAERHRRRKAKAGKPEETEDEEEDNDPRGRPIDIFHSNTVDFLPVASKGNWEKGDVVTSFRELDMLVVFDPQTMAIRWTWGPDRLDRPHDPSVLDNGHLLVFDNGMHRKYSRILEIDPLDGNKEVWTYRGNAKDPFFSYMRGLVQRLPNDNTLITSSQQGRVFEVDREGNVVWEFWGTYVLSGHLRVPIRLVRLEGKPLEFAKKKLAEKAG